MSESRPASQERLVHNNAMGQIARRPALILWPPLDVRRWQCAGLFGALLLLQLCGAAFISAGSSGESAVWDDARTAAFGASMAPPTLLAFWTVFGSQSIAVRLPMAFWLAAANYLALLYGDWRTNGNDDSWFFIFAAWPLAYLLAQGPLWLIRAVGGWRLEVMSMVDGVAAPSLPRHCSAASAASQFSVRGLLGSMLAAALLLAVLRKLTPEALPNVEDLLDGLPSTGWILLLLVMTGVPVTALAWIILADGRRPVLRSVLSISVLAASPGGILLLARISESSTEAEIACLAAGTIVNGVACLAVIAACGYRLRRPAGACRKMPEHGSGVGRPPLSRRRFSFGVVCLLAMAAAVACAAPQRLERWHRHDAIVQWQRGGFDIYFAKDGTQFNTCHIHGAPVADEALDTIARSNRQRHLELAGSQIGDRQLALLAPMSGLRELALVNCELTLQRTFSPHPGRHLGRSVGITPLCLNFAMVALVWLRRALRLRLCQ